MGNRDQGRNAARHESVETRLSGWECVVIKCFAILFLILFLSEKAVKEVGSIRRTWASEITAPRGGATRQSAGCTCVESGPGACCRRAPARPRTCLVRPGDRR